MIMSTQTGSKRFFYTLKVILHKIIEEILIEKVLLLAKQIKTASNFSRLLKLLITVRLSRKLPFPVLQYLKT